MWEGKLWIFMPMMIFTAFINIYSIYDGTGGEMYLDDKQKIHLDDNIRFIGPSMQKQPYTFNTEYLFDNIDENKLSNNSKYIIYVYDKNKYIFDIMLTCIANFMCTMFIYVFFGMPFRQLKQIKNMEKQSKRLQKMGVAEFVKKTDATLLDSSPRGNMLYQSNKIIKHKAVRFLIYQDSSTERMYIKYVPIFDPETDEYIDTADKAQAWSLSMSLERYQKMTIEA